MEIEVDAYLYSLELIALMVSLLINGLCLVKWLMKKYPAVFFE